MDMITRKKLLLRKYNNNVFSNEELDFFGKINATQIIILLKQNPHLRECMIFFEHTSIRELEKLIASIFQPEESFIRSQIFNILVNILRGNTMLLQICFNNDDFNYMSIFGFLEQEHADYPILILLEDVLLPFVRKSPFQIMDIIANDDLIQDLLLARIYQKPVFKIMYTVIFCLSKRHSEIYKGLVKKIIHQLVQTPFTYLMHKEKKSQQKINIIALDQTLMKTQMSKILQSSDKNLPQIHTKKVRQKKATGSSISSEELKNLDEVKFIKNNSWSSNEKDQMSPIKSSSGKSINSNNSLRKVHHQISLQIGSIQQLHHQEAFSMVSIDSTKTIPMNEDLDYGDLTFNMKDLLSDIAFNIRSVYLSNVIELLQNFNESYIDLLLINCKRFITNDEYQGYCQGAISILIQFGELYKATLKYSQTLLNQSTGSALFPNLDYDGFLSVLILKIQKQLKIISSKIPKLYDCIIENNQINTSYSSGQRFKKIGMTKFKMLKLIHQILEFNNKTNSQISFKLNLQINFKDFDVFFIAKKYLTSLKWNNIIHTLITKIIKLTLEQDYSTFKKRYIEHLQMPKDGFLGTLMQLFRNKKFVFLKNMKFTNYGNIDAVYEISKLIVTKVKIHNDYQTLIDKFPSFDIFVNKDLVAYEKNIKSSQLLQKYCSQNLDDILNCIVPAQDLNGKVISTSMQDVEQLIHQIQNSKRWVPTAWQVHQRKQSM